MPLSKRRKKNGRFVKNSRAKRAQRLEEAQADISSGVTFQDLINVLAAQEYAAAQKKDAISEGDAPVYRAIDNIAEQGTTNVDVQGEEPRVSSNDDNKVNEEQE